MADDAWQIQVARSYQIYLFLSHGTIDQAHGATNE